MGERALGPIEEGSESAESAVEIIMKDAVEIVMERGCRMWFTP